MKKDAFTNGTLEEWNPEDLVNKVKERREALNTIRSYGDDIYVIVLDAFGEVDNPKSVWLDIINDVTDERLILKQFKTWDEALDFMISWKKEILSKPAPVKKELVKEEPEELKEEPEEERNYEVKFPHLDKVLNKLNSKSTYDGEEFDALYNFKYFTKNGALYIYDENEQYNIDWLDELYWLNVEAAKEFGGKKPVWSEMRDYIHDDIEKALKQDGIDDVLEWEDNVMMVVRLPEKFIRDSNTIHDEGCKYEEAYEEWKKCYEASDKGAKFEYTEKLLDLINDLLCYNSFGTISLLDIFQQFENRYEQEEK